MANKRDLDIQVGAETDESSFRRAEQKTKGFLSRLRQATPGGGTTERVSGLERSSQILATLGQAAAVVAALEAAASAVEAGFNLARAYSAEAAGNLEESAAGFRSTVEQMRALPLGLGSLVRLYEQFDMLVLGNEGLDEIYANQARANKENEDALKKTQARLKNLADLEKRNAIENRLIDKEGVELEIERSRIALESRMAELRAAKEAAKADRERLRIEQVIQDTLARQEKIEARIRTKSAPKSSPALKNVPLPAATTSLLISGAAQRAAAGQNLEARMAKDAEETKNNTAKTVEALQQLLQATNLGAAAPALLRG